MVRFDTAAPQSPTFRAPVLGLLAGETVEAVDQRPSTGEVFVLTTINRVLLLDPSTGVLVQPGPPIEAGLLGAGQASGIDFNPAVDRLRLVNVAPAGAGDGPGGQRHDPAPDPARAAAVSAARAGPPG